MFYVNRDGVKLSAFRVTAADFNGTEFDGAPFEGDAENHKWLYIKMKSGVITLVPNRTTDYAVWSVPTADGERVLASPGDYIVYNEDANDVYVCDGRLWTLLMLPVEPIALPEPEEPVDLVAAASTFDVVDDNNVVIDQVRLGRLAPSQNVDFADIAPSLDELMGVDPTISGYSAEDEIKLNAWCDSVHRAMITLGSTLQDWPAMLKEVEDILQGSDPDKLPLAWLKTYHIVAAMARAMNFMEPGPSEFESLESSKAIAQTKVNMIALKKD